MVEIIDMVWAKGEISHILWNDVFFESVSLLVRQNQSNLFLCV